ncbi:EndoU domain-containing protein [Paraburkholderia bonniea]|uniref:EndoU domain-containing protein n=1 Tax=Paraburkholderia bonniea TaxID=2152891 RepID=UPI0025735FDE|nr:EndoU domain-containing protein [Paraburkholderia bonniea]WJF89111.1 EndoU domain-containing protein [Paraburkholderia bonniea]WJF92427.1 EndoU domain-containing protein [Paraburkholderia bonniea]
MAGALVTPAGSKLIEEIFKPVGGAVDAIAGLVDFVFTQVRGDSGKATDSGSVSDVNLASPDRTNHILNGDATGGGHLSPGAPGKSVFPDSWSASKIMNSVSNIATDPSIPETVQANGRIVKNGTVDGIDIRVVIEPASKGGGIVTAFPTNVPRNPK